MNKSAKAVFTDVGLDIGRSGIKIAIRNGRPQIVELDIIPSSACPTIPLVDQDEAARAAEETVTVDGEDWWFGETAVIHGQGQSPGNYQGWVTSPEYIVLIHGALKKLVARGFEEPYKIVAGLPSEAGQELRDKVTKLIQDAAGPSSRVKVVAQPAGIYFVQAASNPTLRESGVRCAVLDVGRYSTDLAIIASGRPVGNAFRSYSGVRWAVEALAQRLRGRVDMLPPFERLERALLTAKLTVNTRPVEIAEDVATVRAQFAAELERNYKNLAADAKGAIDRILLGGGGSELVAEELGKLVQIDVPKNPRRAVARGFLYAAQYL